MTKYKPSKRSINKVSKLILSSDDEIVIELGAAIFYEYLPKNLLPMPLGSGLRDLGAKFYFSLWKELYDYFCDSKHKRPKAFVLETTSGDVKDLIVPVMCALYSQYNLSLSILIPATAIIIKHGFFSFCRSRPNDTHIKSVKEVLEEEKNSWKKTPQ